MTKTQSAAGVWRTRERDMSTATTEITVQDQVAQAEPLIDNIMFGDWLQRKRKLKPQRVLRCR